MWNSSKDCKTDQPLWQTFYFKMQLNWRKQNNDILIGLSMFGSHTELRPSPSGPALTVTTTAYY